MDYDDKKYKIAATYDPEAGMKFSVTIKLIYIITVLWAIIYRPVYLVIIIAFLLIHEMIHWIAYWRLNGRFAKFGVAMIGPFVYSGGQYTTRNKAIIQTLAPVAVITAIILIGLLVGWIGFSQMVQFILLIDIAGSMTDIDMVRWYSKYPKEALCGDNGKKNYILLPSQNL